jgi:hypothetical protein
MQNHTGKAATDRMLSRIQAYALGLSMCLFACNSPVSPDPPTQAVQAPPPAPVPVDGDYNGMMQLVSGPSERCGTQDIFGLQVRDHGFRYVLNQPQVPWRPKVTFSVSIAPDGSFHAASGAAYIDGSLSQGHMQGQVVGDSCGFQFEADRGGTF